MNAMHAMLLFLPSTLLPPRKFWSVLGTFSPHSCVGEDVGCRILEERVAGGHFFFGHTFLWAKEGIHSQQTDTLGSRLPPTKCSSDMMDF